MVQLFALHKRECQFHLPAAILLLRAKRRQISFRYSSRPCHDAPDEGAHQDEPFSWRFVASLCTYYHFNANHSAGQSDSHILNSV